MKKPKTDSKKFSLPGELAVVLNQDGIPTVHPKESLEIVKDLLEVVYDKGPVNVTWDSFDDIKKKIRETWPSIPKIFDPISDKLKKKIEGLFP